MRTYLFGNGLSLAYNRRHFGLRSLTSRVREQLSTHGSADGGNLLSELDRIAQSLATDRERRSAVLSFERIAGPLDRLSTLLDHAVNLASIAPDRETRQALRRMSRRLRRIYVRVVGVVLEIVTEEVEGVWESVNQVADHLRLQARNQGLLDVFSLNYDALLDSALIHVNSLSRDFGLMDEFDGRTEALIELNVGRGRRTLVPALGWREGTYLPANAVRLHHLHGAATWMMKGDDVFKANSLQYLRAVGLFSAWARGVETEIRPVVVLGDQKSRAVERWPFSESYEQLASSIESARTVVIAGYGFGDIPLNRVIRRNLREDCVVHVIAPSRATLDRARRVLGLDARRLREVEATLPEGLDQLMRKGGDR